MKTKLLHFTIDFDWLTNQVRTFWAEGNYKSALNVLEACNIDKEKSYDVIRGKLKFAQDPNGKIGCEGIVIKDDWKPDLKYCHFGLYPDPLDIFDMAAKYLKLQSTKEMDEIITYKNLIDKLGDAYKNQDWEEARQIWGILDDLPNRIKDEIDYDDIPWSKKLLKELEENNDKLNLVNINAQIPSVDNFIKHQISLDKKPCPKPTKDFKNYNNGWVLPDGKFYPCQTTMEHIWLAGKLGKTEEEAENAGWVKCSYSLMGIYIISKIKPTQKQRDIVFDWMMAKEDERKEAYELWENSWKND